MLLRHRFFAALLCTATPLGVNANIYTVGSGGGATGCTHNTVQAAVNAAAANPGPDEIRISIHGSGYTNQAIVVNAQDVSITGGFVDCQPFTPTGHTRLSGAGGLAAPVLKIQSTTGTPFHVQLDRLDLVEGDNAAQFANGGGLRVEDLGEVRLSNMRIANNNAFYGAGISIEGALGDNFSKVYIGDNVQIEDNAGSGQGSSGAGIDVINAHLELGGTDTVVRRNFALGAGGGLRVRGASADRAASVDIRSGGQGTDGVIAQNVANGVGGGLFVSTFSTIRLYTTNVARPVGLDRNRSAGSYGGGIYAISKTARVSIWEGVINGNSAQQSGGAFLVDEGAQIALSPASDSGAPIGTLACPSSDPCNLLIDNHANDGAVGMVRNGDPNARSGIFISSAIIAGNGNSSLFADGCANPGQPDLCGYPAVIYIDGSRIAPNFDAATLLRVTHSAEFGCDLCTIASTGLGTGLLSLLDTNGALSLTRSIIWEPGRDVLGPQSPASLFAGDLLLHDTVDFPSRTDIRVGDPHFVAQGAGDFRLAANSLALDSASAVGAPDRDLDGHARVVDQPGIPNRDGPLDLGAYERANDGDVIFVHSFE